MVCTLVPPQNHTSVKGSREISAEKTTVFLRKRLAVCSNTNNMSRAAQAKSVPE